ncbi:MAG: phosphatase PAP2 family protein [Raoultibacter sp.]|jgi:undecaprenyl-diphosphatase
MDFEILYWMQSNLRGTLPDAVMPVITFLGDYGLVWLLVGIALICVKKYRRFGIECVAAVALAGGIVNLLIKPLVDRLRPFMVDASVALLIDAPSSSSFPSGHTAASFAAMVVICSMPIKAYWKILAVLAAFLIAFSRMYLFVHFPSDVFMGMLLGLACGIVAVLLGNKFLAPRMDSKTTKSLNE